MTEPVQYKWRCPVDKCGAVKGPYYDRKLLAISKREHILARHADLLNAMNEPHRFDARMRHASQPHPGFDHGRH